MKVQKRRTTTAILTSPSGFHFPLLPTVRVGTLRSLFHPEDSAKVRKYLGTFSSSSIARTNATCTELFRSRRADASRRPFEHNSRLKTRTYPGGRPLR